MTMNPWDALLVNEIVGAQWGSQAPFPPKWGRAMVQVARPPPRYSAVIHVPVAGPTKKVRKGNKGRGKKKGRKGKKRRGGRKG